MEESDNDAQIFRLAPALFRFRGIPAVGRIGLRTGYGRVTNLLRTGYGRGYGLVAEQEMRGLQVMFALRFLWQKAKLILLRSLLPECRRSRHVQQKNRYSLYPQVHVCATISLAKSKTDSPKKPATSMPSVKTCPAEKQHRAYRNCPGCRRHGTEGRTLTSLRTLPSKALSSIQRDPPRGSFRIRPSLRTARRTAAVGGVAGVGWMADASFQTRCGCSLTSAPCLTRCAGVIFKCT